MAPGSSNNAYATLITRSSYLAGVILLAHSLKKHGSKYPLAVLYTPTLPQNAIEALRLEARHSNIMPIKVEPLLPGNGQKTYLIAARFADTWTKLRVFADWAFQYDQVCYLDADMMIFNENMDVVFDAIRLPDDRSLGGCQICVCNLEHDQWAPDDWTPENCPYTPLKHPKSLTRSTPVPKKDSGGKRTYAGLNGGMFVFKPSQKLWTEMVNNFDTNDHLGDMKFPDQDFLAEFFEDRFVSMPWRFNALKTWRYWHPNMWQDDSVICLHYIVDKPWASRIAGDGTAGYKGNDGVTHKWWWAEYERWREERKSQGDSRLLEIVAKHVKRLPEEEGASSSDEDMKDIGVKVQALASNKK
jgi:alpha-N-acetylglucosamine transferase